jgi:hypothetical protein
MFSETDKKENGGSAHWNNSSGELVEVTRVVEDTKGIEDYQKEFPDAVNRGSVDSYAKPVGDKPDSAQQDRTK